MTEPNRPTLCKLCTGGLCERCAAAMVDPAQRAADALAGPNLQCAMLLDRLDTLVFGVFGPGRMDDLKLKLAVLEAVAVAQRLAEAVRVLAEENAGYLARYAVLGAVQEIKRHTSLAANESEEQR
jgi:hypothetical protein